MPTQRSSEAVAVILAGGRGTRIGGEKAIVPLHGHPMIEYPLQAAQRAGLRPVVVAKRTTVLPPLEADLLIEPDEPHHPLCGVVTALRAHPTVLAIPCDMPFVTPVLLTALAQCEADAAAGTLDGHLQPFPALYRSAALPALEAVLAAEGSIRSALSALAPAAVDVAAFGDPHLMYLAVNTPADQARAEACLTRAAADA